MDNMSDDIVYARTLTSAREFAQQGRIEDWVHAYLLSDGRNKPFSDGLKKCPRAWFGPMDMPCALFERCCGPEEGMKFRVDADGFELRVGNLMRAISAGEDMPPLIVNCVLGQLTLNDGNHRFEAMRRLGIARCNVIVFTTGDEETRWFEENADRLRGCQQ